jgi:LPXTG-site transpeptidase (sortase) family protein
MKKRSTILDNVWANKLVFVIGVIAVYGLSFAILYVAGFAPDELYPAASGSVSASTSEKTRLASSQAKPQVVPEEPIRILIDSIGVDSIVQNPHTTNVSVLDDLLKSGVVRYPGSGLLGKGNMFLFAHSTSIKVVNNQAYKAFNDLDKLAVGDTIKVQSAKREYVYKVTSVAKKHEAEAKIEFSDTKAMLTLGTCDTFSGVKQQRIIVTADLVGSSTLSIGS